MTDAIRAALRRLLEARYDELSARLARRVGSAHLAEDALQDTWLRLEQGGAAIGEVRNPQGYLFRIALNIARDRRRAEQRLASAEDIEAVMGLADEAPGPAAVVEARSDLAALERALAELPERRRAIFLAAWGEGRPHREIAAQFGLTVRMIDLELARAREHCAARLKNTTVVRFQAGRAESSHD